MFLTPQILCKWNWNFVNREGTKITLIADILSIQIWAKRIKNQSLSILAGRQPFTTFPTWYRAMVKMVSEKLPIYTARQKDPQDYLYDFSTRSTTYISLFSVEVICKLSVYIPSRVEKIPILGLLLKLHFDWNFNLLYKNEDSIKKSFCMSTHVLKEPHHMKGVRKGCLPLGSHYNVIVTKFPISGSSTTSSFVLKGVAHCIRVSLILKKMSNEMLKAMMTFEWN